MTAPVQENGEYVKIDNLTCSDTTSRFLHVWSANAGYEE